MSSPTEPGYDARSAAGIISGTVDSPGGPGMLVSMLAGLPAVAHAPPRKRLFRSAPEHVQLGSWRYQVGPDGRLHAAHIVGGIVLAEQPLSPEAAGEHVAAAIGGHIAAHGSQVLPHVDAMLTVLAGSAGY